MSAPVSAEALLADLERERAAMVELLPRFSDEQWVHAARADGWTVHDIAMHLADSHYGLALLALGELPPALPINPQTGWMDVDERNEQRRQKNARLSRAKVLSRMASAFEHARRAIEAAHDLGAPGPYGELHTQGAWLQRIVDHNRMHRQELEELLASSQAN